MINQAFLIENQKCLIEKVIHMRHYDYILQMSDSKHILHHCLSSGFSHPKALKDLDQISIECLCGVIMVA